MGRRKILKLNQLFKKKEFIVVNIYSTDKEMIMSLREWVATPSWEREKYIYVKKLKARRIKLLLPTIEDYYSIKEELLRKDGYLN